MALQAQLLQKMLQGDGIATVLFQSNFSLPKRLQFLERLPGVRTLVRSILIWSKLRKQVREVEVVHVLAASWLYFFLVVYPAVIVGRLSRKHVVLNYRGGEAGRFFQYWGWAAKPIFKLADVVTAPSEFLARVIGASMGVPVAIVSNILNTSIFKYHQRQAFKPRLLVARHLEKIYDIETVLKAFGRIQERYPDASLLIAGTGSLEKHLRQQAAAWGLRNATFLGPVAQHDLPALHDQCDIFLNASRVDNFPGALLEASAAGLVVISTCAGGIPFIYQHDRSALLVEPGDAEGLARAVETVLESPTLALRLTANALDLVRGCDWKQVRRSLYTAYRFPIPNTAEDNAVLVGANWDRPRGGM